MSSNFGGLDILVFVFNGFDMIQVSFGYRVKKLKCLFRDDLVEQFLETCFLDWFSILGFRVFSPRKNPFLKEKLKDDCELSKILPQREQ